MDFLARSPEFDEPLGLESGRVTDSHRPPAPFGPGANGSLRWSFYRWCCLAGGVRDLRRG